MFSYQMQQQTLHGYFHYHQLYTLHNAVFLICFHQITLHPRYNALQYNADSVITRLRSWTPIFQVGLVSG